MQNLDADIICDRKYDAIFIKLLSWEQKVYFFRVRQVEIQIRRKF